MHKLITAANNKVSLFFINNSRANIVGISRESKSDIIRIVKLNISFFFMRLDLGQVSREIFEKMSGGFLFSEKKM